jgi:hypothetical protein
MGQEILMQPEPISKSEYRSPESKFRLLLPDRYGTGTPLRDKATVHTVE